MTTYKVCGPTDGDTFVLRECGDNYYRDVILYRGPERSCVSLACKNIAAEKVRKAKEIAAKLLYREITIVD
jgi:hypothetical protein